MGLRNVQLSELPFMTDHTDNDQIDDTNDKSDNNASAAAASLDNDDSSDPASTVHAEAAPEPNDDTPEMPKNQEKPTVAAPATTPTQQLVERIARRLRAINDLHDEKERHQLTYVYKKVPKPYYARWKLEGNELFALQVGIRRRHKYYRSKS